MKAYIKAISYYLPEKILTNEELLKAFPEWNVEKVTSKVGIKNRHIAAKDETASDMAEKAARSLFEEHKIDTSTIDFIILCTQSSDYILPTTACILQDKLNIPTNCGALDIDLACSGYIYGLSVAKGLIYAGIAKNILFLTAETYTKYIHKNDKGNRSIFGDAASATLISTDGFAEIGNFSLGTDGRGAKNLIVKTGGAKHPEHANDYNIDEGGYIQASDYLYMNGSEIFNFTLEAVPALLDDVLVKNKTAKENVDLYILHQANKYILTTLRKLCDISKDKYFIDLENTGNTVSNTLPIALKTAMINGQLISGKKAIILGFGAGYSWGGVQLCYV